MGGASACSAARARWASRLRILAREGDEGRPGRDVRAGRPRGEDVRGRFGVSVEEGADEAQRVGLGRVETV